MNGCRGTLSYIGLWIGLSALGALTAWFLHIDLLTFFNFIIESDTLRPTYWSSGTLGAISRASIFALGGGWLIFMTWLERALRLSNQEGTMWRLAGRLALALSTILVASSAYVSLSA